MLVLSQDKMTLVELTGKTISIEASTQKGMYGVLVYERAHDRGTQILFGEYPGMARAQEVLLKIMLRYNSKDSIFEMPVPEY